MSTPRGRQFVWELLSRASVFSTSFTADPYIHAYQAGRRDQALPLYEECERLCPELMALARKEADDRLRNRKPELAVDPTGDAAVFAGLRSDRGDRPGGDRTGDYEPYARGDGSNGSDRSGPAEA